MLFYPDVDYYLSICEKVIQKHGEKDQIIMHCIFLGAAGVGKSCLKKRLLGEEVDITTRTSTEIAEKSIRVVSTTVANMSDCNWQKIEDSTAATYGVIGQMITESKEENQKQHKENHLKDANTSEQVSNQNEGSSQASVNVQKDEQVKYTSKKDPIVKQKPKKQERVPDESQPNKSTDDSQAIKSIAKGTSKSQQVQSIDFLQDVLKKEGVSGVKKYLTKQKTIYLMDSGGQPEFQELLPALVEGPCIFIVVLPLNKDLNQKYKVDYVRPGKQERMPTYSSSLTMQEDLMRSLASIAATKCRNKDKKEVIPMAILVATFIDQVPEQDLQEKVDNIEALIKGTYAYKQKKIRYVTDASDPPRIVFTMNNASDNAAEKDAKKIRAALEKIADEYFKVSTPWPWLIFGILVQHNVYENHGSVMSYEKCFKLARSCGIEDEHFEEALEFLHKQTGVLHYYKEPPELSRIVVRDPQHLFSRVNHLVEGTFTPQKALFVKDVEDLKKGLFTGEHYCLLTEEYSSSELNSSMLLKLLEHLSVVVRLDHVGESYFMPCALTHLEPSRVGLSQSDAIPPLLITFKSGYCPKGLFGSLVACIANKQVLNSTLDLDRSEIYRDQIYFNICEVKLLLKVRPTLVYIGIIPRNPDESLPTLSTLSKLCNGVRKLVFENTKRACKTLHYSLTAHTDYFLSFEGRCNQCDKDHPVVLQPVQNGEQNVEHLKVDSFHCNQSLEKVEPSLSCYKWLPEVSRQ